MVHCSKVNVTLSDTQLKKLKTYVKNKTGTNLRISLKIFDEMICQMNCYLQQDKKENWEMHLITICQLI